MCVHARACVCVCVFVCVCVRACVRACAGRVRVHVPAAAATEPTRPGRYVAAQDDTHTHARTHTHTQRPGRYVAAEDETPARIAAKLGVACDALLLANEAIRGARYLRRNGRQRQQLEKGNRGQAQQKMI